MDYLDFEVEIAPGTGGRYTVTVLRSPAGEATESIRFALDGLALENRLQSLQIALLRSGGTWRRVDSAEAQTVQQLGQELWSSLFAGEVVGRLDASRNLARQSKKGLRVKLRISAPELAALPWEYLYDSTHADYLTLSTATPLVRYIPLPQAMEPLEVRLPLRILAMAVSPDDLPGLDIERERARLERAIKPLRDRGIMDLVWLEGRTWRDLQQALRRESWHIFHFVGHGGFDPASREGLIVLADEEGRSHRLSATDLGRLLGDHEPLRLAVLNSCDSARADRMDVFSSTAATLVRRGTPAVVAMQYEITDDAAIEFSRSFYEAIADGLAVDAALAEARKGVAMAIPNTLEWGTPVLFMRAPDGVLFKLSGRRSRSGARPAVVAATGTDVAVGPDTTPPPVPEVTERAPVPAAAGLAMAAGAAGPLLAPELGSEPAPEGSGPAVDPETAPQVMGDMATEPQPVAEAAAAVPLAAEPIAEPPATRAPEAAVPSQPVSASPPEPVGVTVPGAAMAPGAAERSQPMSESPLAPVAATATGADVEPPQAEADRRPQAETRPRKTGLAALTTPVIAIAGVAAVVLALVFLANSGKPPASPPSDPAAGASAASEPSIAEPTASEPTASEPPTSEPPVSEPPEPSLDLASLTAAAVSEGTLSTIALPRNWCNYGEMIDTFKAKFGVDVNELDPQIGSADEIKAIKANKDNPGLATPDVVDLGLQFGHQAKEEGLVQPYRVATWDTIPDGVKDSDGYWYGDYYGVMSFEVNTDVAPRVPRDWADLLEPEYSGMIALAGDPRVSAQAIEAVYAAALANGGSLDDARPGLDFFTRLKDSGNLLSIIGTSATIESGKTPIVIRWTYNALADRDSFAARSGPAIEVVVPASGRLAGIYVQGINAYAPHLNAAKLWMEFLYSDEGQNILLKGYCAPIRYDALVANGAIPSDQLAKVPDVTRMAFPTLSQLNDASLLIAREWDSAVGSNIH